MENKFNFGSIVVVEKSFIGVVVKCWIGKEPNVDVYVRSFNKIENYRESEVQGFIYDKELTNDAEGYYL